MCQVKVLGKNYNQERVMRKNLIRIAAFLLAAVLCVPALPSSSAVRVNQAGRTMVRVGLASTSSSTSGSALQAAHLENSTGYGAGYRFGYFDDSLNFVEFGRTTADVTQIAVVKTQNLWYGKDPSTGKTTYSAGVSSNIAVGCYHIVLPGTYQTFAEAKAAASAYSGGFPAWINGVFQARVGAYTSQSAASQARSQLGLDSCSIVGTTSAGLSVVKTGTSQVLFQYDDSSRALGIAPDVTGAADPRTWFSGYKYRGGFTYRRINGGNITVVNVVELEDYVKGVVCYEMGREWPLEALETQAVCARTYVLSKLNSYNSYGFDVSNTAYSQVYNGMGTGDAGTGPSDASDQACDATRGLVVKYNGKLAETPYSSSHGGSSEDAYNIWGTDTTNTAPYLKGVVDPYEQEVDSRNAMSPWKVSYSSSELTRQVQKYGYGVGTSVQSITLTYSPTANVIKLVVRFTNGKSNTFTPRSSPSIKGLLNLRSIHFYANGQTVSPTVSAATPKPSNPPDPVDAPTTPSIPNNPNTTTTENPGTVTPENPGTTTENPGTTTTPGGSVTVNSTGSLNLDGACVITGDGSTVELDGTPYTIDGDGKTSPLTASTESSGSSTLSVNTESARAFAAGADGVTAAEELYTGSAGAEIAYAGEAPLADTGAKVIASSGRDVTIVGSSFVFSGGGWGHQVGMSQYGANAMARKGFTYDQIVTFYFPGTEIVPY